MLEPEKFVEELIVLSEENYIKAVDKVYRLDTLLEAEEYVYFACIVHNVLKEDVISQMRNSVLLSLITVMLPCNEHMKTWYDRLCKSTYDNLSKEKGEDYATDCMSGLFLPLQ